MEFQTQVAMEVLAEIPPDRLSEVCLVAMRNDSGFLPTNGILLDIWREIHRKERRAAPRIEYIPDSLQDDVEAEND